MKAIRNLGKSLVVGSAFAALVFGSLALTAPSAEAFRPPRLLCGPSYLWVCSGHGPDVLFGGTICEKAAFEAQTGLTCVPYGG